MSTDHNGGAASCPSFRVILYDSEQRLLPFTKENWVKGKKITCLWSQTKSGAKQGTQTFNSKD